MLSSFLHRQRLLINVVDYEKVIIFSLPEIHPYRKSRFSQKTFLLSSVF